MKESLEKDTSKIDCKHMVWYTWVEGAKQLFCCLDCQRIEMFNK